MKGLTQAERTLLMMKRFIPFFTSLSDPEILTVVEAVQFVRFSKHEVVFEQGSDGKEIYFIVKGRVNISVGTFKQIGKLEKYDDFVTVVNLESKQAFGEMSAVTGEARSARATAYDDDTTLIRFDLLESLDEETALPYIKIYRNFIRLLSGKLRNANNTLMGLARV